MSDLDAETRDCIRDLCSGVMKLAAYAGTFIGTDAAVEVMDKVERLYERMDVLDAGGRRAVSGVDIDAARTFAKRFDDGGSRIHHAVAALVRDLCDEVERLRDGIVALHKPIREDPTFCTSCTTAWPCPTLKLATGADQ